MSGAEEPGLIIKGVLIKYTDLWNGWRERVVAISRGLLDHASLLEEDGNGNSAGKEQKQQAPDGNEAQNAHAGDDAEGLDMTYVLSYAVSHDKFDKGDFRKQLVLKNFAAEALPTYSHGFRVQAGRKDLWFKAKTQQEADEWLRELRLIKDKTNAARNAHALTTSRQERENSMHSASSPAPDTSQEPAAEDTTPCSPARTMSLGDDDGWEAVASFSAPTKSGNAAPWTCDVQHSLCSVDELLVRCTPGLQAGDAQATVVEQAKETTMSAAKFKEALEKLALLSGDSSITHSLPRLPSSSFFSMYFASPSALLERNVIYTQWLQHLMNRIPTDAVLYTLFGHHTEPTQLFLSQTEMDTIALEQQTQDAMADLEAAATRRMEADAPRTAVLAGMRELTCVINAIDVRSALHAKQQRTHKRKLQHLTQQLTGALSEDTSRAVLSRRAPLPPDTDAKVATCYRDFVVLKAKVLAADETAMRELSDLANRHVAEVVQRIEAVGATLKRKEQRKLAQALSSTSDARLSYLQASIKAFQWGILGMDLEITERLRQLEGMVQSRDVDDLGRIRAVEQGIIDACDDRIAQQHSLLLHQQDLCKEQLQTLERRRDNFSLSKSERTKANAQYEKWQKRLSAWRAIFRGCETQAQMDKRAAAKFVATYERHTQASRRHRKHKEAMHSALSKADAARAGAKCRIAQYKQKDRIQDRNEAAGSLTSVAPADLKASRRAAAERNKRYTLDPDALPAPADQEEFEQEQRKALDDFSRRTRERIKHHRQHTTEAQRRREEAEQKRRQREDEAKRNRAQQAAARLKSRQEVSLDHQYAHAPEKRPGLRQSKHQASAYTCECSAPTTPQPQPKQKRKLKKRGAASTEDLPPPPKEWLANNAGGSADARDCDDGAGDAVDRNSSPSADSSPKSASKGHRRRTAAGKKRAARKPAETSPSAGKRVDDGHKQDGHRLSRIRSHPRRQGGTTTAAQVAKASVEHDRALSQKQLSTPASPANPSSSAPSSTSPPLPPPPPPLSLDCDGGTDNISGAAVASSNALDPDNLPPPPRSLTDPSSATLCDDGHDSGDAAPAASTSSAGVQSQAHVTEEEVTETSSTSTPPPPPPLSSPPPPPASAADEASRNTPSPSNGSSCSSTTALSPPPPPPPPPPQHLLDDVTAQSEEGVQCESTQRGGHGGEAQTRTGSAVVVPAQSLQEMLAAVTLKEIPADATRHSSNSGFLAQVCEKMDEFRRQVHGSDSESEDDDDGDDSEWE